MALVLLRSLAAISVCPLADRLPDKVAGLFKGFGACASADGGLELASSLPKCQKSSIEKVQP